MVAQILSNKDSSQRYDCKNNFLAGVGKETRQISWSKETSPKNHSWMSKELGLSNCSVPQVKKQEVELANLMKHWLFIEVHLFQLSGSKYKEM